MSISAQWFSQPKMKMPLPPVLTYLELYAGVGGWTMALQQAVKSVAGGINKDHERDKPTTSTCVECAAALDHSDLCLDVYHHNFGSRNDELVAGGQTKKNNRIKACRIEHLDVAKILDFNNNNKDNAINKPLELWVMSPPCQPHTRQHDKQAADLDDPRSQSFLHLTKLLTQLPTEALPRCILLENVVGFEQSASCQKWRHALRSKHYRVAHFHLNPTQVQLPNDRPRYFCVAVLPPDEKSMGSTSDESLVRKTPFPGEQELTQEEQGLWRYFRLEDAFLDGASADKKEKIVLHTSLPELNILPLDQVNESNLPRLAEFLESAGAQRNSTYGDSLLRVPTKLLDRNASWCFDIVTPESRRTACFTSSYGKFVKGTGSILYMGRILAEEDDTTTSLALMRPEDRTFDANWMQQLPDYQTHLRYFSGRELCRLFDFDESFSFPETCSPKQEWKLIGNSINVRVAARLVELALRCLYHAPPLPSRSSRDSSAVSSAAPSLNSLKPSATTEQTSKRTRLA